jgi:hypothetical protein
MDQDEVNSSGIELEPGFAHAGARSLELMLQHAAEDRIEPKKRPKWLQFVHGTKKTHNMNHLWYVQALMLLIVEL